ncbi:hypothetical protein SSX86_027535 [Deinandra increscens subsp. villosa]|uniref:RRM domain-containing protein n=1 Tax=Deinandra increscens subsp. villosa TaxID=3103831 RepID=A0AAP0GKE9_9ASTR
MAQAGFHRFPHPLDPTAQEFRPSTYHHVYLYTFPPPPPPTMAAFMIPAPSPPLPPSSIVPTRALLLSSVPAHVSESTVRRDLEVFGDVRAVQMERLPRDGIVTVHFYDLRQATEALNKIQEQHMQQQRRLRQQYFDALTLSPPVTPPLPARGLVCGRVVWAQFAFPIAAGLPDRYNQGTVTVTSDSDVLSTNDIRNVFEAFGDVKGITWKKTQKMVEFYDTRAASKAVAAVNGQEIHGKKVAVEFNRHIGPNLIIGYHNKKPNKVVSKVDPPPCRKDRLVIVREVRSTFGSSGGLKKNVVFNNNNNNNSKNRRQSPEKWVSGGRNKQQPWKGAGRGRSCDPRFLIKDEAAAAAAADAVNISGGSFQDSRTTVMIKNIPNKYRSNPTQKLLLDMLDNHCIECNERGDESSYDFVYLPIDFVNKCNVGYGFVNMTSAEGAWRLYKAFNHQNWEVFNSKKICEVSYARLQGLKTLKEHFKNSRFPCEEEEYMPVVFTPPRDGRTVTEPIPIVACRTTITSSDTSSSINNKLLVEDAQSTGGGDDDDDI